MNYAEFKRRETPLRRDLVHRLNKTQRKNLLSYKVKKAVGENTYHKQKTRK